MDHLPEASDEALCFGWIDGVRKKIDARSHHRSAPGGWQRLSEVNIKRVGELTKAGRMHESGIDAFRKRDPEKTKAIRMRTSVPR